VPHPWQIVFAEASGGRAMRTTTLHCCRCRCTITGGHSILEVKAGALANRFDGEPRVDLCGDCADQFMDWLRSHENTVVRLTGQRVGCAAG
jgi:hypothetical protein